MPFAQATSRAVCRARYCPSRLRTSDHAHIIVQKNGLGHGPGRKPHHIGSCVPAAVAVSRLLLCVPREKRTTHGTTGIARRRCYAAGKRDVPFRGPGTPDTLLATANIGRY